MLLSIFALLAWGSGAPVNGGRLQKRDGTLPVGVNPIKNFSTQYLGRQTADNSCSHRDLGFTGQIAGKWYAIFGDTLWCAPGVTDEEEDTDGFHGMVRDSVSLMTDNPLIVHDLNLNSDRPIPHQNQFVPFNASWGETQMYGFGGTSLCETSAAEETGLLFYLVVRPLLYLAPCFVIRLLKSDRTPMRPASREPE